MHRALLVVGKAPRAGLAKTRLVPPLLPDDAAQLYRGFLCDSVAMALELGWERVSLVYPHGSDHALRSLLPPAVHFFQQPGEGLQDALVSAFASHFGLGFDRVVLIASDTPTLPSTIPEQACVALETHDLAIGPSVDGGYYLIGMRKLHAALFEGIDWSTHQVFRQTMARATGLRLRIFATPEWYDVDEPDDLIRLRADLESSPTLSARHTRAALDKLGLPLLV
jgi:rSAM/selenodomain-associated transferase 1